MEQQASQNSAAAPAESQRRVSVFWLMLTTLGLLILAEMFRDVPCWMTPVIVVLLAYPIWAAQRESFLFNRRVALLGATHAHSQTRRLFWNGQLGVILHIPLALGFAVLLLALSVNLTPLHWLVLGADAVILALSYGYLRRKAASQVRPELLGVFVRRWPLWLANLGLLTLAFFILNFFVIGAPDLRQTTWHVVAEQAFASSSQLMKCTWSGWLVGSLSAFEQASWALAQQFIPNLPGWEWRFAAWVLFLLQLSLLSIIFTNLQLGVLSLVEARAIRVDAVLGESTFAKTFIVTILVLALLSLLLSLHPDPPQQPPPAISAVLNKIDPCQHQTEQNEQAQSALNAELVERQDAMTRDSARRIDREVDLLFAPVEARVDDYLDWYFTVIGEYERLAAVATGNFAEMMAEQLEEHLFVSTGFHAKSDKVDQALMDDTLTEMASLLQSTKEQIDAQVKTNPCLRSAINPEFLEHFDHDVWRAGTAFTSGALMGGALLSKKVVVTVVAKVGAKKSFQAAAVVAAKMALKKGGGTALSVATGAATGTAICAPSGPVAILCGIGGAIAAWVTVDKVAIEIDEAVNRDEMRADILDAVEEVKRNLKMTLRQRHASLIGQLMKNRQSQTTPDGVFKPSRDGL